MPEAGCAIYEFSYQSLDVFFEAVDYRPSPEQRAVHEALLKPAKNNDGPCPTTVIVGGGEQGGKSLSAGRHAFAVCMASALYRSAKHPDAEQTARIGWLVGSRYEDTKLEYQYIRDAAVATNALERPPSASEEGPWTLFFRGGVVVHVLSSEDTTKLAREAPDWIVLCEPGRQSYEAFQYAWRRVVPRNGWLLIPGTFEGYQSRWLSDLWRQCQGDNPYGGVSLSIPSYANPSLYPLRERDPKFLAACRAIREANPMEGEEEIAERFLGIPRTPKGLVFSEFRRQVHVKNYVEFEPSLPVILWTDHGYDPSAYAVMFVQIVQGQIRVFDEIYVHRMTNDEVITLAENHETNGVPVFGNVSHVVLDVAAKQHAGAQGSAYETWLARMFKHNTAKRQITLSGQRIGIEDRNSRIHDKLRVSPLTGEPFLAIAPRCKSTIWEFEEGYRQRVRQSGVVGSDTPIDKDNHAVAAIGYGIVDRYGLADIRPDRPAPYVNTPLYVQMGRRSYAGARR